MPSIKAKILKEHIDAFMKQAGERVGGEPDEIVTDIVESGLSLRLKNKNVFFTLRFLGIQKTIGAISKNQKEFRRLATVTEARALARDLKFYLEAIKTSGKKSDVADEYLNAFYSLKARSLLPSQNPTQETSTEDPKERKTDYQAVLDAIAPSKATTWTFEQCFKRMIEDRTHPNWDQILKESSIEDMKSIFNRLEFSNLLESAAANINLTDIEVVRDKYEKKYGINPARKLVTYTRSVFEHSYWHNGGHSGLQSKGYWWRLLSYKKKTKATHRVPTLEEVAKVIILAEHFSNNPAPWYTNKRAFIGKEVYDAFLWVCFTAQRQNAAVHLLRDDLEEDVDGWKIAKFPMEMMKGNRKHMLPIPPTVIETIPSLKLMEWSQRKKYIFSSYLEHETPVNRSATFGVIAKLRGPKESDDKDKKHKYSKHKDFLTPNGILYFSPHDIRRTLVRVLDAAGVPGGASAILDHKLDREKAKTVTDEDQRLSKTTEAYYGEVERIPFKKRAMKIWTDALLEEIARLKREWKPMVS